MTYPGGKAMAKHVLEVLNDPVFDNMEYIEPFVGLGNILYRVENKKSYKAGDNAANVIDLLSYLQKHKRFPNIDAKIYRHLKDGVPLSNVEKQGFPLRILEAFASISTFNGIYWKSSGFADKSKRQDYKQTRANYYTKLLASSSFKACTFKHGNYYDYKPRNCLIYCDPPYLRSQSLNHRFYNMTEPFDHHMFWEVMREWSKTNIVFVSESDAPDDFQIVASKARKASSTGDKKNSHEYNDNLYTWKHGMCMWGNMSKKV